MKNRLLSFLSREKFVVFFFLSYFLLGMAIFRDYGAGWDELFQNGIGWVNYVWVFGGNPYLQSIGNFTKYYGPIYEIFVFTTGLLVGVFHVSGHPLASGNPDQAGILWRHFWDFTTYFIGTIYFYLLAKKYTLSRKIAILGTVFLIFSPRLFADSFYNSKDTVFMAFFIVGIYYLVKFLEKRDVKSALLFSLTSALAIDVRVLAFLIPFFACIFLVLDFVFLPKARKTLKREVKLYVLYVVVAGLLVVLMMPYLWPNPVGNFLTMWAVFAHYPQAIPNLYRGHYVIATDLPWHYVPWWIFITTPPLYIVLFILGLLSVGMKLKVGIRTFYLSNKESVLYLLWFFLPILMVIVLHSNLYNAWRQMFFVYPGFILIAISGVVFLIQTLKKQKTLKTIVFFGILVSLLYIAKIMMQTHPYQNVYFNMFAGANMKVASKNYETDYWGVSYKKGLEYILTHDTRQKISIATENDPGKTNSYLLSKNQRQRLIYIDDPKDRNKADYYLTDYFASRAELPYKKVYSVTVEGAVLTGVYKLH